MLFNGILYFCFCKCLFFFLDLDVFLFFVLIINDFVMVNFFLYLVFEFLLVFIRSFDRLFWLVLSNVFWSFIKVVEF